MTYSVLLHNIRSIHNVGSIFRTADGVGFSHLYLSGYTPSPIDRFGRHRADLAKVALGAEEALSWSIHPSTLELIQELRSRGVYLVALEQSLTSIPYDSLSIPQDVQEIVLVVGEETRGIESEILELVDAIIEIPMRGTKESLNVSVAFGIASYSILKKAQ